MPLEIGDQVRDVMEAEGITLQELEDMISRAAITSQRGATRRYHHWFFVYDQKRQFLERMFMHLESMDGIKDWTTCEKCGDWGCVNCQWSGQIPL